MTPQFTDVIKVHNGQFYNLDLHLQRISSTIHHFFGKTPQLTLDDGLIPQELRHGLVKCRILYSDKILNVEFSPYIFRPLERLIVVENNSIDYSFKFLDRSCFTKLQSNYETGSEILIIKNHLVTDTSYSNVVFEDDSSNLFTPDSVLLNGLKRQSLIDQGRVQLRRIDLDDIWQYRRLYLINAMIDIEDNISIECSQIQSRP